MTEPIQVHRIRRIAERGHGPFEIGDLEYILRAYADMEETLKKIEEATTSTDIANLATDCLNRVRS
jgi:hypothetical protein